MKSKNRSILIAASGIFYAIKIWRFNLDIMDISTKLVGISNSHLIHYKVDNLVNIMWQVGQGLIKWQN
jgi:hypothetical protein